MNVRVLPMLCTCSVTGLLLFTACDSSTSQEPAEEAPSHLTADTDNGSITLSNGFGAYVVADNVGKARHIVVRDNGDIYVKLREAENGGGILALRDTNGDGRADTKEYFIEYGGTGIDIYENYLYYSSDSVIYRVALDASELVPTAEPEVVVQGFPIQNQHAVKPFTFDGAGNMYVNIGAPSNACQEQLRTPKSPGQDPCPQLDRQAGIWKFSATELNQTQEEHGERYATGIRNAVALDWNKPANSLYALQHGRDQLSNLWSEYYDSLQSAELPAEEFLKVSEGADFGWPFCYYDPQKNQKVLAPEYGGNGEETGRCADKEDPIMAFPAHWAPNDLIFYNSDMFPEKYRSGAFIAFHGSWNRAPLPQKGYNIAFVPFGTDGMPSGDFERFADEFAGSGGEIASPGDAEFRPTGLAVGSDGSLYITDDQKGRIWRVFYQAEADKVALAE
ncbi:PQQ-dependent sugar dehydrogenase [Tunicatimonas pelagia]|uniref:PQQ-dependent sugar dehydrogenase n=1 Tax=Tunicatimonas pelagia TaxID=931531 RepID=UPI002666094C|nr:PQQ-dependent sugar dehydrogenase [Tunicatimonas pelagia]WKN43642.1 PQQ-dependent sugar dehydrogenase [Tunicatimonas pelagia]